MSGSPVGTVRISSGSVTTNGIVELGRQIPAGETWTTATNQPSKQ